MKQIPETENPLVLRAGFSNQAAWESIHAVIQKPVDIFHFRPNAEFVDDLEYSRISRGQLLSLIPKDYSHSFVIFVDQSATSLADRPLPL